MAHHISYSKNVNLSAPTIWNVLNDFGGLEKFAPTVKSSPIVGDKETGVGAKRRVTIHHDGSSMVEEIIKYHDGQGYVMAVTELSSPLKSMQAEMRVDGIDERSSTINMSADITVKGGPLGWLMGKFLIGPMMKGVFKKIVEGLAYHAATGRTIDTELPDEGELESAIRGLR